MENPISSIDSIEKADCGPAAVPGTSSPSATRNSSERTAQLSAEEATAEQPVERSLTELSDVDLGLKHHRSLPIHLEPPPVVKRPPKVKNDSFSLSFNYQTYSLFSWSRTEQKEVLHCARASRQSYEFQTTFRLLGFNISKKLTYKASESGIDALVEHVRMASSSSSPSPLLCKFASQESRRRRSAVGCILSCSSWLYVPLTPLTVQRYKFPFYRLSCA